MDNLSIQVTFIDALTGKTLGDSNVPLSQLPETFEVDTTLHLGADDWQVKEAIPVHSKDFKQTKSVQLKIQKVEYIDINEVKFTIPTLSKEVPEISSNSPYQGFELLLHEDDWRQSEFLTSDSLPRIDIETNAISEIWKNHHTDMKAYNSFTKIHVRDTIGEPNLSIPLKTLLLFLEYNQIGQLKIDRQGFVKNGFALKTNHSVYYGTIQNEIVKELCIKEHTEESLQEILKITQNFSLIFVDWYNRRVIS
jgi:hypothetical protein